MWIVRKQIDTAKRLDDTRPRKRHTDCWHKGHSVGATRLNMDHGGTVVPFLGNARNAREAVAVASNASVSGSGDRSANAICLSRHGGITAKIPRKII